MTTSNFNLNDLFGDGDNEGEVTERVRTPWAKYDRKTQFIKFRFLEDLDELKADTRVTHKVENVSWNVRCNLKPIPDKKTGGVFLWNGWGAGVNKKPEHNCEFCAETKEAVDNAVANFGKDTPEGKKAAIEAKRLHQRTTQFVVNVEYEIWEVKTKKGKPVSEKVQDATQALMGVRINDLFSDKGKGEYKTLNSVYKSKGTICDRWFTMDGEGKITADDKLDGEQTEYELFPKPQVMEYKVALDKHLGRKAEADKSEPLDSDDEMVDLEDDDQIPF